MPPTPSSVGLEATPCFGLPGVGTSREKPGQQHVAPAGWPGGSPAASPRPRAHHLPPGGRERSIGAWGSHTGSQHAVCPRQGWSGPGLGSRLAGARLPGWGGQGGRVSWAAGRPGRAHCSCPQMAARSRGAARSRCAVSSGRLCSDFSKSVLRNPSSVRPPTHPLQAHQTGASRPDAGGRGPSLSSACCASSPTVMCGHLGWRIKIEATLSPCLGQIRGVLASKGLLWAPLGGRPGCQKRLGHATPMAGPTPAHPPAPVVGLGGQAGDLDEDHYHPLVCWGGEGKGGEEPPPSRALPSTPQRQAGPQEGRGPLPGPNTGPGCLRGLCQA